MDELVKASVEFLEYLVLGGLLLGCILISLGKNYRNQVICVLSRKHGSVLWEGFLLSCLAGLICFLGVVVSDFSYWFLEPAHVSVMSDAQEYGKAWQLSRTNTAAKPVSSADLTQDRMNWRFGPDLDFYFLPITRNISVDEVYIGMADDYYAQEKWEKEDPKSYGERFTSQLKRIKLIRGGVLIVPIFLSFITWRRAQSLCGFRFLVCLAVFAFSYWIFMTCYWTAEMDGHCDVVAYRLLSNPQPSTNNLGGSTDQFAGSDKVPSTRVSRDRDSSAK
jgi:hypothetical protein